MAQYSTGTVDLTNGSAAVTGTGTAWLTSGATAGSSAFARTFTAPGDGSDQGYVVSSIASDVALTLAAPWAGPTVSGAGYILSLDFTQLGFPLMDETDVEMVALINLALERITTELIGLGAVP